MSLLSFTKSKNTIAERCRDDGPTRMRLTYAPYYHTFERQEGSRVWLDGREMIMLSSNDYLGLTHHPKVIEAGKRALDQWGGTTSGARLSNGSRSFHTALEEKLAAFLGKEACHVSAAGYLSCVSGPATFARKGDIILVDKNVHASLWEGIRLSGATIERFSHNSVGDLKEILGSIDEQAPKLLVVEGVYSMEGHLAPLPEILEVTAAYGCLCLLDDAHGVGVLGENGRGCANHFGVTEAVDLITGSLSKSLSSTGGFVAGSRELIEYLRTHSRQTVFSAGLSPVQAACAFASIEIMESDPAPLARLWENTRRYRNILEDLGLDTWGSKTPAIPIVLGSKERAYRFWKLLMDRGIFTVMSIAPGVPPGKDLIRTSISARHTEEDLDKIAGAFQSAVRRL